MQHEDITVRGTMVMVCSKRHRTLVTGLLKLLHFRKMGKRCQWEDIPVRQCSRCDEYLLKEAS